MGHKSVLLHEAIDSLEIKKGETFFDGTLGSGGHSAYVCNTYGSDVALIGVDRDIDALERAEKRVNKEGCSITTRQANFKDIGIVLNELGIKEVNAILLDIGLSSNQFEESGRGFSFKKDEPLLMTFEKNPEEASFTAKTIVNNWDADQIEVIIKGYGEDRYARRIAKAIVENRPLETTTDLVNVILEATPKRYHHGRIHPATRTFQALRIAVNDEIESLRLGIANCFEALAKDGRLAVISFHSIEDRIVKNFFKDKKIQGQGEMITKKPIVPSDEEIEENPRARSAKLRIIKKI